MNKKSFPIVVAILGLIFAALVLRSGDLLTLAIPFLVYLLVGLLHAPTEINLQGVRILDRSSVIAGEPVDVRLVVENRGDKLVNLYLKDEVFAALTLIDGAAQRRAVVFSGEATELTYRLKAARGVYRWKTIHARASDPFGLFEQSSTIGVPGELFVRPAPMRIHPLTLRPRATLPSAGPVPARRPGSGTDFWGVRQYRAGDTLRWVNWRLAARYPHQLFTNEFEREEIADFGMIVDARKFTSTAGIEETLFEYSLSAAASLAEIFLRSGNRVSLLVFGKNILANFPGYGLRHYNALLHNLALAQFGGDMSFSHLQNFPTQLFPARSYLLFFSPVDPRDAATYAYLRSIGHDILLVSPDPVGLTMRSLPLDENTSLAGRAARIERRIHLVQLQRLGVHVIDWPVDQPLEPLIRERARSIRYSRN